MLGGSLYLQVAVRFVGGGGGGKAGRGKTGWGKADGKEDQDQEGAKMATLVAESYAPSLAGKAHTGLLGSMPANSHCALPRVRE